MSQGWHPGFNLSTWKDGVAITGLGRPVEFQDHGWGTTRRSLSDIFRLRCLLDVPVEMTNGGWISKSGVQGRRVDWGYNVRNSYHMDGM